MYFAGSLYTLDRDKLTDERFVSQMKDLLGRTQMFSNSNARDIARDSLKNRGLVNEEGIFTSGSNWTPSRRAPIDKLNRGYEVMVSIEQASAYTGISIDDVNRLVRKGSVCSANIGGQQKVQLCGNYPCGQIPEHVSPRHRGIGAKQ